jgi:hypothetical protein
VDRDTVTTWLDLAALVLLAVGAAAGAWLLVGAPAVGVAGLVLLAGSRQIDWVGSPDRAPAWWRRLRSRHKSTAADRGIR